MANNNSDVVNKIMRYKLQLTNTEEASKILKTLKKLKDLEITLDVLAETGIGKTVNTLRRHELAGDLAKTLVRDWKALVPKGSNSPTPDDTTTAKYNSKKQSDCHVRAAKEDLNNNHFTDEKDKEGPVKKKTKKDPEFCRDSVKQKNEHISVDFLNRSKVSEKKKRGRFDQCHKERHDDKRIKSQRPEEILGEKKAKSHKREKYKCISDFESDRSDGDDDQLDAKSKKQLCPKSSPKTESKIKKKRKHNGHKGKSLSSKVSKPKEQGDPEEPVMSFEAYLNYDENVSKRKECPKPKKPRAKPKPAPQRESVKVVNREPGEDPGKLLPLTLSPNSFIESTVESVLKTPESPPLESWFPEAVTGHQRRADKDSDPCDALDEMGVFTGQRLNKKMQVYSGAKTIFLPAMMSLYQQCIRTLQNNINLLYETGGVPFVILEPVLERCTPEQLLRIEEYNPIYIGETDHLWGNHCKRNFKDAKLQEYESWKEMYLRLSEERERKFKMLTKTIVSAQSSKPKGRQVKMAFIHSVAKPPRDVRIKQEMHGTAVQQPQPKCSVTLQESRQRPMSKESSGKSSGSTSSSAAGTSADAPKRTKVAPMMAKSLKAFKKQFSRR